MSSNAMYGVCTIRRTNVYLDERQLKLLRLLAMARDVPVAALVREAIDSWLETQGVREVTDDEWRRRFDELMEHRRRVWKELGISEDELERDIADAVREVREARAAARRR
jgi:hypothetical protein